MQQRQQDSSWGVSDWVELADTVLDLSGQILELGFDLAWGVVDAAGSLLFSLLDVF